MRIIIIRRRIRIIINCLIVTMFVESPSYAESLKLHIWFSMWKESGHHFPRVTLPFPKNHFLLGLFGHLTPILRHRQFDNYVGCTITSALTDKKINLFRELTALAKASFNSDGSIYLKKSARWSTLFFSEKMNINPVKCAHLALLIFLLPSHQPWILIFLQNPLIRILWVYQYAGK